MMRHCMAVAVLTYAAAYQAHANPEITVDLPGGAKMDFVWIAPGVFTMGTTEDQEAFMSASDLWSEWREDEHPAHEVSVSHGFWLGKYEVTQGQWVATMGTTPWEGRSLVVPDPDHPAVDLSWNLADDMVSSLNAEAEEGRYRLPTEAEWEYACRSGSSAIWHFGDDPLGLGDYAWSKENTQGVSEYGHEVGTRLPNAWGLHDMHGNVWEWVQDWYGAYPDGPQIDPQGPAAGSDRVLRGGDFQNSSAIVRTAVRSHHPPNSHHNSFGTRLVFIGPVPTDAPTVITPYSWGQAKFRPAP